MLIEAAQTQLALWNTLSDFIATHFYQPDLDALRIVLAACLAHFGDADPVWLFVNGPSRSGKTAIIMGAVGGVPKSTIESDITPKAFLPGKKGGGRSLLNHPDLGPSFIIGFKDFTTMLSKREDDQREIMAIFREVYDRSITRKTGEHWASWAGKITIIAAATPAIERAWAINRELGERFLQVRWPPSTSPRAMSKRARSQCGLEMAITQGIRTRTAALFQPAMTFPTATLTTTQEDQIDALATLVAWLRQHVVRDTYGKREIIDVSSPEEPTSIGKCLALIACSHATLFGRSQANVDDMHVIERLATDSIPLNRWRVIRSIPKDASIYKTEVARLAKVPGGSIGWHATELVAIGACTELLGVDGEAYATSAELSSLWADAFPRL